MKQQPFKRRAPLAVAIFSVLTLGIYAVVYWYKINKELADYGREQGTDELGTNPRRSALALFPGALLVVPAIWTTVTTFKRVQAAQRRVGKEPLTGWIGAVLYIALWPAVFAYIQSGLNSVRTSDLLGQAAYAPA